MLNSYRPSKRKFGAFVIAVSLFELAGCAGPSFREKIDVYNYKLSCDNREEQRAFLLKLRETAVSEKDKAWFDVSFNLFAEDRDYKSALAGGRVVHDIDEKLFNLEHMTCRKPNKKLDKPQ